MTISPAIAGGRLKGAGHAGKVKDLHVCDIEGMGSSVTSLLRLLYVMADVYVRHHCQLLLHMQRWLRCTVMIMTALFRSVMS